MNGAKNGTDFLGRVPYLLIILSAMLTLVIHDHFSIRKILIQYITE